MKTAVSIPTPVFNKAERLAKRLGTSRSALYSKALEAYVDSHDRKGITEALNAVYATQDSRLDPVLARIQAFTYAGTDEW